MNINIFCDFMLLLEKSIKISSVIYSSIHIYLLFLSGCFHTTTAEVNIHNTDYMAQKSENIY